MGEFFFEQCPLFEQNYIYTAFAGWLPSGKGSVLDKVLPYH
jgi:hypothetical protein